MSPAPAPASPDGSASEEESTEQQDEEEGESSESGSDEASTTAPAKQPPAAAATPVAANGAAAAPSSKSLPAAGLAASAAASVAASRSAVLDALSGSTLQIPPRAVSSTAAPAAAPAGADHLILEAEPGEDLVIISNATGCGAWIGQAIEKSQFVAVVRTPASPATSCIVQASLAEKNGAPAEARQRPWVAFRVRRKMDDPKLPLSVLSGLSDQLAQAGVEVRTLVPVDSRSYILVSRERIQAAVTALVRSGHLVLPFSRVCPALETPVCSAERIRPHVGAWQLTRCERGNIGSSKVEDFGTVDALVGGGPLRIQASTGLFVEFRSPKAGGDTAHASCFGTLSVDDMARSLRQTLVSFQPPGGAAPPNLKATLRTASDTCTLQEEAGGAGAADADTERVLEHWLRTTSQDKAQVTALELAPDDKAYAQGRRGAWLFCGKHFVRILGPPRGDGLVGGSCCKSLAQLEAIRGADPVRTELRRRYEAVLGEVEQPGLLRVRRDAWDPARAGAVLYNAAAEDGAGGSVEVNIDEGLVKHQPPEGEAQRWRIREWGADPFTRLASEKDSDEESEEEDDAEGSEEEDDEDNKKDAEGQSSGSESAKKAKGAKKAKAAASSSAGSAAAASSSGSESEEKEKKRKKKKDKEKRGRSRSHRGKDKKKDKEKDRSRRASEHKKEKNKKSKDKDSDDEQKAKDSKKAKEKAKGKRDAEESPKAKAGKRKEEKAKDSKAAKAKGAASDDEEPKAKAAKSKGDEKAQRRKSKAGAPSESESAAPKKRADKDRKKDKEKEKEKEKERDKPKDREKEKEKEKASKKRKRDESDSPAKSSAQREKAKGKEKKDADSDADSGDAKRRKDKQRAKEKERDKEKDKEKDKAKDKEKEKDKAKDKKRKEKSRGKAASSNSS